LAKYVIAVLLVALIAASVFAILPVVADAPWESSGVEKQPLDDGEPSLPISARLDVEDAVRRHIDASCSSLITGVHSEFLGDATWEVSVEFQQKEVAQVGQEDLPPQYAWVTHVAVFRVRDRSLAVSRLNDVLPRCTPGL
jgi:hypothetical protein